MECPPLTYANLANETSLHEFDRIRWRLVDEIRAAGFRVERLTSRRVNFITAAFADVIARQQRGHQPRREDCDEGLCNYFVRPLSAVERPTGRNDGGLNEGDQPA